MTGDEVGAVPIAQRKLQVQLYAMKTVTMLELRRNAQRILEAVRRGERVMLTYRGEAVARLEPVHTGPPDVPEDDPVFRIDDYAVDGAGGSLTDREIDKIVYDS
jgi:prevent-host-death family protein